MSVPYEYRVQFTPHRDLEAALNKNAAEGWLVETILPAVEWGIAVVVYYREVVEG